MFQQLYAAYETREFFDNLTWPEALGKMGFESEGVEVEAS
jgi:hypothetical protein